LWQNSFVANEMHCTGQIEQAHARGVDAYERLEGIVNKDMPYLDAIRHAIAHAIAYAEVLLGYPTVERWLSIMERDAIQVVSARKLRRALFLMDGDIEAADRCQREAELLSVQSHAKQMFEPALFDLYVARHGNELTELKHTADHIAGLASRWPGWRLAHHVAQGSFQYMRGDLPTAKAEFERALAVAESEQSEQPPVLRAWVMAGVGYTMVLTDLGELEAARAFGLRLCERCHALGITSEGYAQVRALALAEARLGDHTGAIARLDELMQRRTNMRPSFGALDFEARARVAILAKDAVGTAHFMQRAIDCAAAAGGAIVRALRGRMLDEAQQAGLALPAELSGFTSPLLAGANLEAQVVTASDVIDSVERLSKPLDRANRFLELLTEAAGASVGHLYYVRDAKLVRVASRGGTQEPGFDQFANEFLEEWLEQTALTTVFTHVQSNDAAPLAAWWSASGAVYRVALLAGKHSGSCIGLVAFCDMTENATLSPHYRSLAAALGAKLLKLEDLQVVSAR
jgi:hypothetical protein